MASPNITHVNETNFAEEVLKSDKIVLIDFYADWCGPCKALAPTLEKFAAENPNVKVVKINTDENQNLAQAFGIQSIPTILTAKAIVTEGQTQLALLGGRVGNVPKSELEKLVKESEVNLQQIPAPGRAGIVEEETPKAKKTRAPKKDARSDGPTDRPAGPKV